MNSQYPGYKVPDIIPWSVCSDCALKNSTCYHPDLDPNENCEAYVRKEPCVKLCLGDVSPRVSAILEDGATTFKERHDIYGDNYKRFGEILMLLFPGGVHITDPKDANRLNLLIQITGKVTRYAEGLRAGKGGHLDSAHDMMVYAAMLQEMTEEELPF